jgi:hypothetical protein
MIVQPSPAAGRGWHVLQTITTLVVTFVLPPAAHASPHPLGSQTGSDALVGILVVAEEEPSSKARARRRVRERWRRADGDARSNPSAALAREAARQP